MLRRGESKQFKHFPCATPGAQGGYEKWPAVTPPAMFRFRAGQQAVSGLRIAFAQSEATRFERRDSLREAVFL